MTPLSSKERMLRTLRRGDADYIPCCFMSFTALRRRVNEDLYALADQELAMGLDSMLFIPAAPRPQRLEHPDLRGLPVRFSPAVETRCRRKAGPGGVDFLHREYRTPDGILTAGVQLSDDWPHGDLLPFVDDFQIPRAVKHLVTEPEDLPALQHLLTEPDARDRALFQAEAQKAREFARDRGVLLTGGWGVGADLLNWLCGMQELMALTLESPRMVADLLEMVHVWNRKRMELVLSGGVDLYIRRAWYEGCDFITRGFFRSEVLPRLKAEADLAHEHGAAFGYICTSGLRPMLDCYLEAGIDVLIGIDPIQGTQTDMPLLKCKLGDRICLWGGVSGAVTVELGSEDEVRAAVRRAVGTLGPGGFILSPVDNLTVDEPRTWHNVEVLRDEWMRIRELKTEK